MPSPKRKVLFFSPHAGIWAYSFLESLVADSLQRNGYDVARIGCGKVFPDFCLARGAMGLTRLSSAEERARACETCTQSQTLQRRAYAFAGYDLADLSDREVEAEVEKHLGRLPAEGFLDYEVEGVQLARIAVYEALLQLKKINLTFSEEEWAGFRVQFANCLRTFLLGKRVLDRERPDLVVVYNSHYSVHATFCELARQRGIPVYFLHAGDCLSKFHKTLMIGQGAPVHYQRLLIRRYADYEGVPATREVGMVADHFVQLLRSRLSMTYSSAIDHAGSFDLRAFFGIRPEQKLLVATLSSLDERITEELVGVTPKFQGLAFSDQIEWVRFLVEYVKSRPELFLVIRVHPREFPNKRDNVTSSHARLLAEELKELPSNVRVNWPSDQISIFTLAQEADVFLNAWSTAGKEMAFLGIPVVIYSSELLNYSATINALGVTREAFVARIEEALANGWSLGWTRKALRWYSFEYVYNLFDLSDGARLTEYDWKKSRARHLLMRILAKTMPSSLRRIDLWARSRVLREDANIQRLFADQSLECRSDVVRPRAQITEAEEERVAREALSVVAPALFANQTRKSKLRTNWEKAGVRI